LNGATTVILKGYLRILILVVLGNYRKHKVTQFYTAPTAIRSSKRKCKYVQKTSFKTLKVIGSVGEPLMKKHGTGIMIM
jgi:acetyl-CoA synthetase